LDSLSHILSRVPRKDLKYFLQGAFAGDGYVGLTKKGTIHEINFTSKDVTSLNLVAKVLSVCGIRWHKDSKKYQIRVYGYENFVRLANMDIFHCHSARHRRFERGLREMAQKLSMVA
jgi:hypothetical protein